MYRKCLSNSRSHFPYKIRTKLFYLIEQKHASELHRLLDANRTLVTKRTKEKTDFLMLKTQRKSAHIPIELRPIDSRCYSLVLYVHQLLPHATNKRFFATLLHTTSTHSIYSLCSGYTQTNIYQTSREIWCKRIRSHKKTRNPIHQTDTSASGIFILDPIPFANCRTATCQSTPRINGRVARPHTSVRPVPTF